MESASIAEGSQMKYSNYTSYLSQSLKKLMPKKKQDSVTSRIQNKLHSIANSCRVSNACLYGNIDQLYGRIKPTGNSINALVTGRRKKIFSDVYLNSNRNNTIDINCVYRGSIFLNRTPTNKAAQPSHHQYQSIIPQALQDPVH